MTKEKYALLDTDFISKTHLIRKDNENRMIDRIIEMPGYQFYCHEQIRNELARNTIGNPDEWLNDKIVEGCIQCITDERIIDELQVVYSDLAAIAYINMLKNGCEAYKKGYFEENFTRLRNLNCLTLSKKAFLKELEADCEELGDGRNLGELKSYVLLQTLNIKLGEQIYVFCSDDKNARNGIVSLGGVRCISVLSAFMRLDKAGILSKSDAEPYIRSYLDERRKYNLTTFKVHDSSKEMRICRVPCEKIFEEMYTGKLEELQNGNLRYTTPEINVIK